MDGHLLGRTCGLLEDIKDCDKVQLVKDNPAGFQILTTLKDNEVELLIRCLEFCLAMTEKRPS